MNEEEDEVPSVSMLVAANLAGNDTVIAQYALSVYEDLRRLSQRLFRSKRRTRTAEFTAAMNDTYRRCAGPEIQFKDPEDFFRVCSAHMRRILVSHIRRTRHRKRSVMLPLYLTQSVSPAQRTEESLLSVIEIDAALTEFEKIDPRRAKLLELRYFGGLTEDEILALLESSDSILVHDLRFAKAWLIKFINREKDGS
jgi:RNA polymerase sigma factor (TIGR02999 family)